MSYYKAGTITVTLGSASVPGVGTLFVANVKPGDILQQGGASGVVKTVNSDTSLTLENVWGGATAAGTALYAILHSGQGWFTNGAASAALASIAAAMGTAAWAGHPTDLANPHQVTAIQAATAIGLSPIADRLLYFTGAASAALATLTATGRSIIAAASQAAAITALGILGIANSFTATQTFTASIGAQITGASPLLQLVETDQVLPAGSFRIRASGGSLLFMRNTAVAGDYATSVTDLSISPAGTVAIGTLFQALFTSDPVTNPVAQIGRTTSQHLAFGGDGGGNYLTSRSDAIAPKNFIINSRTSDLSGNPAIQLNINNVNTIQVSADFLQFSGAGANVFRMRATGNTDDSEIFDLVNTADVLFFRSRLNSGSAKATILTMTADGFVGVGTGVPKAQLSIGPSTLTAPDALADTQVQIFGLNASPAKLELMSHGGQAQIALRRIQGSIGAATATASANVIGSVNVFGHDGTSYTTTASGSFQFSAANTFTPTSQGTNFAIRLMPTGSVTIATVFGLSHDGNMQMGAALDVVIGANRHFRLRSYTVAGLPSAATAGELIYVSNGTGNKRLAVSDGTNWRFPDGAVVS